MDTRTQQSRSEQALKYTFNPFDEKWHSQPCRVVIEKKPFAEGGMRFCLRLFELEENGDFMPVTLQLAACPARLITDHPDGLCLMIYDRSNP